MELNKQALKEYAVSLGFADARFAGAEDRLKIAGRRQPRELMNSASAIVVLFYSYKPALPAAAGSMALSAYYIASHRSYHAARLITDYIKLHGGQALHTDDISSKGAALQTGGFLGDNGFYYHPEFGSFVCIQTVVTDAFEPDVTPEETSGCLHCGVCEAACPSQAVGRIAQCLRYHSNGLIPEALRSDVYQLLGCERCQTACPLNSTARSEPVSLTLEALLTGEATKALRELAGPNMARRGRLFSQAALYAANTRQTGLLDLLTKIAQNEAEPIAAHARWALDQLNGDNE